MPNINKANTILDTLIDQLKSLKEALNEPLNEPLVQSQAVGVEDFSSFEQLKKALQSDKWPEAVNPNLICDPNSDTDKIERARGIVELMVEDNLEGMRFLDYGCGEGQTIKAALENQAKTAVGYDIVNHPNWNKLKEDNSNFFESKQAILSSDLTEIKNAGPYDIILLFDVLDHLQDVEPIDVMKTIHDLLDNNGKVYIRCHPSTSRHATHLYHELNKAYVHLVLSESELKEIIPETKFAIPNIGITRPIAAYNSWFEKSGFKILNKRDITEKVEPFFQIPKIAERVMKTTKFGNFPDFQLSLQFVDYSLQKIS